MIQPLTNLNMSLSKIVIIGRSGTFRLDNFWTLEIGHWQRDWKLGDFWVNWDNFGQLGDFWISNFHSSNLLDKRLALGQILGNWEGFLVNGKIHNPNPHWKLNFEKLTGLRR